MSNGDIVKILQPGQKINVQTRGEFIYLKEGLGTFAVTVFDRTTGMEAGDSRRFEKQFDGFEIENLSDSVRRVVLVAGTGDFDRFIVKGEIQIEPALRAADGSYRTDTRLDLGMVFEPTNLVLNTYEKGDVIATAQSVRRSSDNVIMAANAHLSFTYTGPGQKPYYSTTVSGLWGGETWEFDPETLDWTRFNNFNVSSFGGSGQDVAYSPVAGYLHLDIDGKLYKVPGDGNRSLFIDTTTVMQSAAVTVFYDWKSETIFCIARVGNQIEFAEISNTGDVIRVEMLGGSYSLGGNELKARIQNDSSIIYVGINGGGEHIIDRATMTYTSSTSPIGENSTGIIGFHLAGNYGFYMPFSGSSLNKRVFFPFITKPEFRVSKIGCAFAGLLKSTPIQVKAAIVATERPEGVTLTGELIKAAIEFYFKREAPADYLDHVYGLTASRDDFGLPFKTVNTGNRSFAAAGIADSFGIMAPSELILKIDNELTLGGAL